MSFSTVSGSSSMMVGAKRDYIVSRDDYNNDYDKSVMQTPTQPSSSKYIEANENMNTSSSKKMRGRPIGSKNKPKVSTIIKENNGSMMEAIVIEISAGKDIVETLINLAHTRQANLTILSGFGLVSDVTLLNPVSRSPSFLKGPIFQMMSLSGTYINANCAYVPPRFITQPRCSSFSIYLSAGRGQVFGGIVGGEIKAVGVVRITATLFVNSEFHRMAIINQIFHEFEEDASASGNGNGNGGGVITNVVTPFNNNNTSIHALGFGLMSANQQIIPTPPPPVPTDVNVIWWNHSPRFNQS
uniref:AT-hook motif nuclear-localized protein 28-like n=1 Tax=Cicer arietinum TaxID=3827 RepID=A0A1S2XLT3_CICAR|nr:AT-hook motif nuclear-localized protein 28-like [Cicer arietinum]